MLPLQSDRGIWRRPLIVVEVGGAQSFIGFAKPLPCRLICAEAMHGERGAS